jgi:hypothetical protein
MDEAIAAFRERFDEARTERRVSEHIAQLADGLVDRTVEADEGSFGPQSTAELLAGDNLSGIVHEREQQPQWLFTQADRAPCRRRSPESQSSSKTPKRRTGMGFDVPRCPNRNTSIR